MSDIPEDIRKKAEDVYYEAWLDVSRGRSIQLIAEALMAERERAAAYHDDLAAQHEAFSEGEEWHVKAAILHRRSASAIRSPGTAGKP